MYPENRTANNQLPKLDTGSIQPPSNQQKPLPGNLNTLPPANSLQLPPAGNHVLPANDNQLPTTNQNALPPISKGNSLPIQNRIPVSNLSEPMNSLPAATQQQPPVNLSTVATEPKREADDSINRMTIPGIQVETIGPKKIAKGKPATYKIRVKNGSGASAEQITVGFELPNFAEATNISTTGGQKEVLPMADKRVVRWQIASIGANQSVELSLDLIPQKAEAIELNVRWAIEPKSTATRIAVTEPKLQMKIDGPEEVQFGTKTIYSVTIENVGTGLAEDIKVRLSQALGGAQAPLGHISPGANKKFQVELTARNPGKLELVALATGQAQLKTSASKTVTVRKAKLEIAVAAPKMIYAGAVNAYDIVVVNRGDAVAKNVTATASLPAGVKYLSGIQGGKATNGKLSWNIGNLAAGDQRRYRIHCQMNSAGVVKVDFGVLGANNLAASSFASTKVDTIADLVLSVEDPKGPLPTGEMVEYTIRVKNRGSRTANNVNLVMHFSDFLEPSKAEGLGFKVAPGEVKFTPIRNIAPGKEILVKVSAKAFKAGNHTFRAQLKCDESESLEVSQGRTKFYGDTIANPKSGVPTRPVGNRNQFMDQNQFPGG